MSKWSIYHLYPARALGSAGPVGAVGADGAAGIHLHFLRAVWVHLSPNLHLLPKAGHTLDPPLFAGGVP
jgi:hypothetical protein